MGPRPRRIIDDGTSDAFDNYGSFTVERPDVSDSTFYFAPAADSCGREDGDREITYPEIAAVDGLRISRKVYVPAAGDAFSGVLDTIRNPTGRP